MDYKAGDKVVLRSWYELEKEYGLSDGAIKLGVPFRKDTESSLAGTDRAVVIDEVDGSDGTLLVALPGMTRTVWVTPETIQGYAFKVGERIQVRDSDNRNWMTDIFCYYKTAQKVTYPIQCAGDAWAFARPLAEDVITIKAMRNGKEISLTDLSEETLLALRNGK